MSEKWKKEMYMFEKGEGGGGSFGAVQVEKEESLEVTQAEKWGAFGRHILVLP